MRLHARDEPVDRSARVFVDGIIGILPRPRKRYVASLRVQVHRSPLTSPNGSFGAIAELYALWLAWIRPTLAAAKRHTRSVAVCTWHGPTLTGWNLRALSEGFPRSISTVGESGPAGAFHMRYSGDAKSPAAELAAV